MTEARSQVSVDQQMICLKRRGAAIAPGDADTVEPQGCHGGDLKDQWITMAIPSETPLELDLQLVQVTTFSEGAQGQGFETAPCSKTLLCNPTCWAQLLPPQIGARIQ